MSGRQGPFAGSDREARGRLMAALNHGPVTLTEAPARMAVDAERAARLIVALESDGLVLRIEDTVRLP